MYRSTPILLFVLFYHCVFCTVLPREQADEMTLTLMTEAASSNGAVCLDGSPGAYYFISGSGSGANKWFLYHQGGGWCESDQDCYGRSKTVLGSSKTYPSTMATPSGYFSSSPAISPLTYNWNKVYFMYCDGGSFSGNNETAQLVNGVKLYYRGFRILQAYAHDLLTKLGMNKGTDFLVLGCSAGGLATYLHVDWWKSMLPQGSLVKGMPDSGFFLDFDSTDRKYGLAMRWVFDAMNATSGVDQDCINANKDSPSLCMFAEHTGPHITTPIFPLQSIYDSWQIDNILGAPLNDTTLINDYGTLVARRFRGSVFANPLNGAFLDSCYHHCAEWDSIKIDNLLSGVALADWYLGGRNHVHVQVEKYPCDACCKPTL
eukprot:TRINITY_DN5452_c0_g1_i1.p1 TRINITY_DN5452_c0_g1~~TRINITY_DN5452_c0_g1_i1.p1  ORF type:complete len:374 (-),score=70.27 TRINITY_DN5452_c0_g1_i1:154-1275(-)